MSSGISCFFCPVKMFLYLYNSYKLYRNWVTVIDVLDRTQQLKQLECRQLVNVQVIAEYKKIQNIKNVCNSNIYVS